jgi:hypothetical protein
LFPQLLSKLGADRNDPGAHELVRPLLLRLLLLSDPSFAGLAVSVLASSLEAIPMSEPYARAIVPLLVAHFLDKSHPAEHVEYVLSCLLHAQQFDLLDSKVALRCSELIRTHSAVSSGAVSAVLHPAISLLVRVLERVGPSEDEALFGVLARLFAAHQSELKFEALSLILLLLPIQTEKSVQTAVPSLRQGLFDIVRARKSKPLWAVMRCATEITKKLRRLKWAFSDSKDTFFPLLMGLVGVEVSLAFDKEQRGSDSQMLMVCLEMLEMTMSGLGDENDDEVAMLLLPLRAKLNDTCRVGLEFLIEAPVSKGGDDIRPLVSARMVSSWACLDPEAFKEKEVIAALPAISEHLPWFLRVMADFWIDLDEIRDSFVLAGGMKAIARLLESRLVVLAKRLADPTDLVEGETWDDHYAIDPVDCTVSALSVLISAARARKNLGLESESDKLMQALHDAARALMGRRGSEDCTLLMGFVIGGLAQMIRIGLVVQDLALREKISSVVALYLPAAVANEGLSSISAISESIEGGDAYGIRSAMNDLGVADLLRSVKCSTQEQSAVVKKLLSLIK